MTKLLSDDLLRGAKAIGEYLGVSERAAFHLLESKDIPGFKLGGRWTARKSSLDEHCAQLERSAAAAAAAKVADTAAQV